MRLRLSKQAVTDLERIFVESVRGFGIQQADAYQAGLRESMTVIADHPHLARERAGFRRPIRIHPYESHIIAYLVDGQDVLVVRILHAHQNLRRFL